MHRYDRLSMENVEIPLFKAQANQALSGVNAEMCLGSGSVGEYREKQAYFRESKTRKTHKKRHLQMALSLVARALFSCLPCQAREREVVFLHAVLPGREGLPPPPSGLFLFLEPYCSRLTALFLRSKEKESREKQAP